MSRGIKGILDDASGWITWGTPIITLAFYGLLGWSYGLGAIYGVLQNTLVNHDQGQPIIQFGEAVGVGVSFILAWTFLTIKLYQTARKDSPKTTVPIQTQVGTPPTTSS